MAESTSSPKIPPGQTTITVKLINPVTFGPSVLKRFMAPAVPGLETFDAVPSNCFLLEHPSGRRLVWDLGIRSDYQNYSPKVAAYIPTTKYNIRHHGDVADVIQQAGIDLKEIEAVIWSHWHWDHIGNPAVFPSTTDLVVGHGFKEGILPGAPTDPESFLSEESWRGRNLREIDFTGPDSLKIGQFEAFDYFGDGSFYLLDSPGHAIGHLCGLARTSANQDTFILLGGDVCHYSGIMRPSANLPLPENISPNPFAPLSAAPFCPGHAFEELQTSRGRQTTDTLYTMTYGHDIPVASNTVKWLQELDCDDNIFVIIAHDAHVEKLVDHFPKSLNSWKAKGWGAKARWAWLSDLEPYWKSQRVTGGRLIGFHY